MERLDPNVLALSLPELNEMRTSCERIITQALVAGEEVPTPSIVAGALMGIALQALAEASEHNLEVFMGAASFYVSGEIERDPTMCAAHEARIREALMLQALQRMDTTNLTRN